MSLIMSLVSRSHKLMKLFGLAGVWRVASWCWLVCECWLLDVAVVFLLLPAVFPLLLPSAVREESWSQWRLHQVKILIFQFVQPLSSFLIKWFYLKVCMYMMKQNTGKNRFLIQLTILTIQKLKPRVNPWNTSYVVWHFAGINIMKLFHVDIYLFLVPHSSISWCGILFK